jgi:hypothetical protein
MIPVPVSFFKSKSGINPMSFGQPLVYYQSFDLSYISPSVSNTGDFITSLSRYTDSSLVTTSGADGNYRSYVSPTDSGKPFGLIRVGFPSSNAAQRILFGDTSTLSGMHSPSFAYSLFLVHKPLIGTANNFLFITLNNFNARGIRIDTQSNNVRFSISDGSGVSILQVDFEQNVDATSGNNKPLRVHSLIAKDTVSGDFTTPCVTTYDNGVLFQSAAKLANFASGVSGTQPYLYGRQATGNLGRGDLAELIIINQELTEAQHLGVVQFLMNRWGIT